MRQEPTLVEKIAMMACLGELEGALVTIKMEGTWTPEVGAAIATRREQLERQNHKR